jgi:hypothetical protein
MVVVVALKVAVSAAAATVTDAGTVSVVLVFVRVTTAPPLGAAPFNVTVQTALLELLKVAGVHDRPETVGKETVPVTVPPVPDMLMPFPKPEEEEMLLIAIGVLVTPAISETFTTARTPFEIVPAFMPEIRQEYAPTLERQLSVLAALAAAGPTLPAGYVRVHWTAAGSLPDGDVKFRFSEAVPPTTMPELRDKESVCPKAGYSDDASKAIKIKRLPVPLGCFLVACLIVTLTVYG